MLCAVRVPGEPILTTAATCGTAVRSSLGLVGLPQWSQAQAYTLQMFISLLSEASSPRQTQGVMVMALSRQHKLRARCAASALRSSAEAASSVLSTSSESWIARVGRANSSTRQKVHGGRPLIEHVMECRCPTNVGVTRMNPTPKRTSPRTPRTPTPPFHPRTTLQGPTPRTVPPADQARHSPRLK